jgi:hypothetical protein
MDGQLMGSAAFFFGVAFRRAKSAPGQVFNDFGNGLVSGLGDKINRVPGGPTTETTETILGPENSERGGFFGMNRA